jgi:hypothetical protein
MIRFFSPAVAACLAGVLLASAAQAQQKPPAASGTRAPATPPASAAAPSSSTSPSQPSASHVAAARELATLSGVLRVYDTIVPQFTAQIRKTTMTRPELTKDLDQVLEALKPDLEKEKQAVIDGALRFYTTAFTEPELKELNAFFRTRVGQKYIQVGPRLLDALATETRRWADKISEALMAKVRAEMAKRGHQL